jgi:hypothetical protein
MHKNILAIIFFNESVPLFLVEPFNYSFRHDVLPPPLVVMNEPPDGLRRRTHKTRGRTHKKSRVMNDSA